MTLKMCSEHTVEETLTTSEDAGLCQSVNNGQRELVVGACI